MEVENAVPTTLEWRLPTKDKLVTATTVARRILRSFLSLLFSVICGVLKIGKKRRQTLENWTEIVAYLALFTVFTHYCGVAQAKVNNGVMTYFEAQRSHHNNVTQYTASQFRIAHQSTVDYDKLSRLDDIDWESHSVTSGESFVYLTSAATRVYGFSSFPGQKWSFYVNFKLAQRSMIDNNCGQSGFQSGDRLQNIDPRNVAIGCAFELEATDGDRCGVFVKEAIFNQMCPSVDIDFSDYRYDLIFIPRDYVTSIASDAGIVSDLIIDVSVLADDQFLGAQSVILPIHSVAVHCMDDSRCGVYIVPPTAHARQLGKEGTVLKVAGGATVYYFVSAAICLASLGVGCPIWFGTTAAGVAGYKALTYGLYKKKFPDMRLKTTSRSKYAPYILCINLKDKDETQTLKDAWIDITFDEPCTIVIKAYHSQSFFSINIYPNEPNAQQLNEIKEKLFLTKAKLKTGGGRLQAWKVSEKEGKAVTKAIEARIKIGPGYVRLDRYKKHYSVFDHWKPDFFNEKLPLLFEMEQVALSKFKLPEEGIPVGKETMEKEAFHAILKETIPVCTGVGVGEDKKPSATIININYEKVVDFKNIDKKSAPMLARQKGGIGQTSKWKVILEQGGELEQKNIYVGISSTFNCWMFYRQSGKLLTFE